MARMARAEVFALDEVAVVHRFYHNLLGTWFTTDPIGYQSGPNLFEYCQSRPQIAAVPFGLKGRGLVVKKNIAYSSLPKGRSLIWDLRA